MLEALDKERARRAPFSVADARELFTSTGLTFCITAGRTGTQFASRLFDSVPGVTSLHEPPPCFTWVDDPVTKEAAADFWLKLKLPAIAQLKTGHYVETSHVVGRGFVEPLIDLGCKPNLLMFRRPPRETALSFLEKYTVPARTWLGMQWLAKPEGLHTSLNPGDWRELSDYQLCFWHVLEMEEKQRLWINYKGKDVLNIVDLAVGELHDFDKFLNVLRKMGTDSSRLPLDSLFKSHAEICGRTFNKTGRRRLEFFGDIDRLEEDVWDRVASSSPSLRAWIAERYSSRLS